MRPHRALILLALSSTAACSAEPTGPSLPQLVGTWSWIGSEQFGDAYDVGGTARFGADSLLSWFGTIDYHDGLGPRQDVWTHSYGVSADTLTIEFPGNPKRWLIAEEGAVLTLSLIGAEPPEQVLTLRRIE